MRVCAACPTPRLNQSYELRPPWEQHLRYFPHRVRNGYNTHENTIFAFKMETYTRSSPPWLFSLFLYEEHIRLRVPANFNLYTEVATFYITLTCLYARLQNFQKRLLASTCLSACLSVSLPVRPSVRPHRKTRLLRTNFD